MPRRFRGPLTLENVQTGDGRVFAPGAIQWAPLPLNWMVDGASLHLDLATRTPQVGIIESITREGDQIIGEGQIFDETPEGAEVIRRMDAGQAPLGNAFPVSIDPDNWEVEIVLTDAGDGEDDGIIMFFSGQEREERPDAWARIRAGIRAAAGDPDPGPDGGEGGVIVFTDRVDEILERYTMLRIRGATLCDIAAFDGATITLDAAAASDAGDAAPPVEEPVAAAAGPVAPPREWFFEPEPAAGDDRLVEQPDGSWACPLTITDDGRVYGHVAASYGQCHAGHRGCVSPPRSRTGYAEFHVGEVVTAEGEHVPTGRLVVGCDHARLSATASEARDHYANSGQGWADVRVVDGQLAPWVCGALVPSLTDEDLRMLRSLTMSGDWRDRRGNLELVSILSVNTPGFPVVRSAVAASAAPPATVRASAGMDGGRVTSLVAAGLVHRCPDCAARAQLEAAGEDMGQHLDAAVASMQAMLEAIDRRTRHLIPDAEAAIAARVHAGR